MNFLNRDDLAIIFNLLKPHILLLTCLQFGLGAAIARYLGQGVSPDQFLPGLAMVLLVQISSRSLTVFFRQPGDRMEAGRKLSLIEKEGLSTFPLSGLFYFAAGSLTLAATIAAILLLTGQLPMTAALILAAGSLLAIAYGTPPLRLETSGYGELTVSFLLAAAVPAFSYSLFTEDLHRLIPMSTVAMVGLLFAVQIALSLVRYGEHSQKEHRNLLVRLGWRQGMWLHDATILLSFLSLGIAFAFGLPRRVALGSFMVLPLAIVQIWYLSRIRAGLPVRWRLLGFNSHAMVALMSYLTIAGYLLS